MLVIFFCNNLDEKSFIVYYQKLSRTSSCRGHSSKGWHLISSYVQTRLRLLSALWPECILCLECLPCAPPRCILHPHPESRLPPHLRTHFQVAFLTLACILYMPPLQRPSASHTHRLLEGRTHTILPLESQ